MSDQHQEGQTAFCKSIARLVTLELQKTLFLIPTELERHRLLSIGGDKLSAIDFQLCGFGPVLAAIRTTALLASGKYDYVLLCGIAGAYANSGLKVGAVVTPSSVKMDAIGVVDGGELKTAQHLGFSPCLPDALKLDLAGESRSAEMVGERERVLLTVCTASENAQQALNRENHFVADVEDMEGYGVAGACQHSDRPLTIVRGISNIAGDRDKSRWDIDAAIAAVAQWLVARLG